jgi:hypothetical protein
LFVAALAVSLAASSAACTTSTAPEPEASGASEALSSSSTVTKAEKDLLAVFNVGPQNGGTTYHVASTDPIEAALKDYVKQANKDDPDSVSGFSYHLNASGIETDTQAVGTISNADAWSTIRHDLSDYLQGSAAGKAKAKKAFDALTSQGVVFGYDGWQESGCAAPTDFLLLIDPHGKTVFTLELTPCDES